MIDLYLSKLIGDGLRLLTALPIQGVVGVSLNPVLLVPVGLAMADHKDRNLVLIAGGVSGIQ
jgi:hypothetical protein